MMEEEDQADIEFDDVLVKLFLMLHRYKYLQWLVLLVIRLRDKLDSYSFIKKPITKEVDEMDNCHFRTLYGRFPFDDNYTDPDFLCSMQLNTNLNYYTFGEAVLATTRLSLAICPCTLYVIFYFHLSQEGITPDVVFFISGIFTIFGYLLLQAWLLWGERPWTLEMLRRRVRILEDGKTFGCCGLFSYLLVPILRTVTTSMATESVHAVCFFMFGLHILANDYGLKMPGVVSKPLSMNSAIFAMICLASRLQSDEHCLALLAFGTLCFISFPQLNQLFWKWPTGSGILMIVTAFACFTVSFLKSLCFVVVMFMIVIVAPAYYIYSVQFKVNILGPWDEAKLDLTVNMEEIERGFARRRKPPQASSSSSSSSNQSEKLWEDSNENRVEEEDPRIAEMEAKGIGQAL